MARIIYSTMLIVCIFCISCTNHNTKNKKDKINNDSIYAMRTLDIVTLISDSGITKYKLNAKEWIVYDKLSEPSWFFPKGIYIEKFDSTLHVNETIQAKMAWNYTNKRLWLLKGDVKIKNIKGEYFNSEELYWDEKKQKVYSNKLMTIIKDDGKTKLKGYSFESNQEMTEYIINKPHEGTFSVSQDSTIKNQADSIKK